MRKLALLASLALPSAALASAYSVPNTNARDLGVSEAFVAAQEGAGAVFGNPAALSRLEGLDISLTAGYLDNKTTWNTTTGLQPSPVSMDYKPVPPPALFAAWGGKLGESLGNRGWGVGVGLTVPYGGNVFWPKDWPGRFNIVEVDRKVFGIYLTGGVEILPWLRVGGGPVYFRTTETLTQKQDVLGTEVSASIAAAGGAFSYDVAAEIGPFPGVPVTLGIDYKHKAHQQLDGDARFDGVPPPLQPILRDQTASQELIIPNVLNLAVAVKPVPDLTLGFTVTLDRYVVYKEDRFVGETLTLSVPRNYQNGWVYRFGAEYALSPEWQVRAGVLRDVSGVQPGFWSPSLPDRDVWAGSLGGSYRFGKGFGVHLAGFYAKYDDFDTTRPAGETSATWPAFPGLWQTRVWIFSAGISWRWQPDRVAQVKQ